MMYLNIIYNFSTSTSDAKFPFSLYSSAALNKQISKSILFIRSKVREEILCLDGFITCQIFRAPYKEAQRGNKSRPKYYVNIYSLVSVCTQSETETLSAKFAGL